MSVLRDIARHAWPSTSGFVRYTCSNDRSPLGSFCGSAGVYATRRLSWKIRRRQEVHFCCLRVVDQLLGHGRNGLVNIVSDICLAKLPTTRLIPLQVNIPAAVPRRWATILS